jgi:hypothetical protein
MFICYLKLTVLRVLKWRKRVLGFVGRQRPISKLCIPLLTQFKEPLPWINAPRYQGH